MVSLVQGELRKKKPGYGFLKCDDGSPDCFMLPTSLIDGTRFDEIAEGERFQFEPYEHVDERTGAARGRRARNISRLAS
jgi:cold shock CspA family protein